MILVRAAGMSSLASVDFATEVRKLFGVSLSAAAISRYPTVRLVAAEIHDRLTAKAQANGLAEFREDDSS